MSFRILKKKGDVRFKNNTVSMAGASFPPYPKSGGKKFIPMNGFRFPHFAQQDWTYRDQIYIYMSISRKMNMYIYI